MTLVSSQSYELEIEAKDTEIARLKAENADLQKENERLNTELSKYRVRGTMHISREEFEGQSEKGIEMPRDRKRFFIGHKTRDSVNLKGGGK